MAVRQYRTLKWLKGGRQDPSSQDSINRTQAIRSWAINAQEQLKERWAQMTHEDHEMVSRLEVRLPNGLILAVEGDPNRSWRVSPEPESVMMAKLRAAISTTEWAAVTALYGKPPAQVVAAPLQAAMDQAIELTREVSTPARPRQARQVTTSIQPQAPTQQPFLGINGPLPA